MAMNKLNVGDYVRTNYGISKILELEDINTSDNIYITNIIRIGDGRFIVDSEVIKSSPNIIDLIEVGDYVNGNLVSYVGSDSIEVFWYKDEKQWLDKEDIKSIVTKESFENISYKVGE